MPNNLIINFLHHVVYFDYLKEARFKWKPHLVQMETQFSNKDNENMSLSWDKRNQPNFKMHYNKFEADRFY